MTLSFPIKIHHCFTEHYFLFLLFLKLIMIKIRDDTRGGDEAPYHVRYVILRSYYVYDVNM